MRATVRATPAGTVGSLEKEKPYLELVDLSQDTEYIKEYFGNRPAVQDFDGFLVKVEDGDYSEVYGFEGNIAYTYKPVFKITRTYSEARSKQHKPKSRKSHSTTTSLRSMR